MVLKEVTQVKKHKCISKNGTFCCGNSVESLERFLRRAFGLVLKALSDKAITTSVEEVIRHNHYPLAEGKVKLYCVLSLTVLKSHHYYTFDCRTKRSNRNV